MKTPSTENLRRSPMNGDGWTKLRRGFALVTQACAHAALWMVVAFAWCIRKTATPAAKIAGQVEEWCLVKLGERSK
jgi:hypothetical protein